MSEQQILNAQRYAESKGKYFSSADGKTYASYQDAVDAQKPSHPTGPAKNDPNQYHPGQKPKAVPGPPIDWLKNETQIEKIKAELDAGNDYSHLGGSPFVQQVPSIGLVPGDPNKLATLGGY